MWKIFALVVICLLIVIWFNYESYEPFNRHKWEETKLDKTREAYTKVAWLKRGNALRWQHFAIVQNNEQITFYLDGEMINIQSRWRQLLPSQREYMKMFNVLSSYKVP